MVYTILRRAVFAATLFLCAGAIVRADDTAIRIGHFPNVTHAHALIAHNGSRTGKGWFESRAGAPVRVEWYTYNAGPSAMEALLTGALDFCYVGPNPALNAFIRTKGREVRVLAGATRGGSALVIQTDGKITSPADFKGKTVGTPQLGNTQDVSARVWLKSHGIRTSQTGGDATILPAENPEMLSLFLGKKLDAAWTVEPWVTRLEAEGQGAVFFEDRNSLTTILVASAAMVRDHPDIVASVAKAHADLTEWMNSHPAEMRETIGAELKEETGRPVSAELISKAVSRMKFDAGIGETDLRSFVEAAQSVGFLKDVSDIRGIMYADKRS